MYIAPSCSLLQKQQELMDASYCIISDNNNHDVSMVYEVQRRLVNEIKGKLPNIKKLSISQMAVQPNTKIAKTF